MNRPRRKRIFLDYASATPVLPKVKRAMDKYWSRDFYNPSAIYEEGVNIKKEVENCRGRVARALGVTRDGITFTASGTESNNLAILGTFESFRQLHHNKKPHLIISAIEHPAVFATAKETVRRGGEMSILDVDENGLISIEALRKILKKNTFLVSVGLANNEIGIIQPISKIGRLLRSYRKNRIDQYPYLHTDASQAANYLEINLENLQSDLLTLDGAKIYGPKGIGILAMRKNTRVHPIIFGGGQESGRRSGTLSPALITGFTTAFEIVSKDRERESNRLEMLRKHFIKLITQSLPSAIINSGPDKHLPNIISVSVPGILSEFVVLRLNFEGIMASIGSACSFDGKTSGSPIIIALGGEDLAEATLRFSLGRFTTKSDINRAAEKFCRICKSVIK